MKGDGRLTGMRVFREPPSAAASAHTIKPPGPMRRRPHRPIFPLASAAGGAAGIVITLLLVLSVAGAGAYWAYTKYYRTPPLRTQLAAMKKTKEELVRFTHDHVSTALYRNLITIDDAVVMMDKETDRLKRIAKKFPNQKAIIASQTQALDTAREKLAAEMAGVIASLEKIYVTWLVDRSRGRAQINAQRGTLTRKLADAIRGEAVLIGRIRSNAAAAT